MLSDIIEFLATGIIAVIDAMGYAGVALGNEWHSNPTLSTWLHRFDALIILAILGLGGLFLWHKLHKQKA
ncbi:MAG: hypothetical protein ACT6Q8_24140 [Niveispirillum sp.]|uniref:hypothetical protein n=1 Tax=Niveispirillum sp. TaxID=1917217 RepID=UPI004036B085